VRWNPQSPAVVCQRQLGADRRSEIQALMPFDIAEGAERTELDYVRRCYVSQRFRAFMEKHKVSGSFRLVEIVDD